MRHVRGGIIGVCGALGVLVASACSSPYGAGGAGGAGAEQADTATAPKVGTDKTPTEPGPGPVPAPQPQPQPKESPALDGGPGSRASSDAAAADPNACPSHAAPTITPWKAPPAVSSACSASDMTYFASVAANQTWLGVESLMKTRNQRCAQCIFSHDTDAVWRPVIYSGTEGNAWVNYGACFARTPGGSEACGRGVDAWSDCYGKVCDATACGTDAALKTCYASPTVQASCDGYNPTTICGGSSQYASLNNVCGTYIEVARALCAAGN